MPPKQKICTIPSCPPRDPPETEVLNARLPDPSSRSPPAANDVTLTNPPLPNPAPLAVRETFPFFTFTVGDISLITPPLPLPTPLALRTPPFEKFRLPLAKIFNSIAPPLPLVPSGDTFRNDGSTVML